MTFEERAAAMRQRMASPRPRHVDANGMEYTTRKFKYRTKADRRAASNESTEQGRIVRKLQRVARERKPHGWLHGYDGPDSNPASAWPLIIEYAARYGY